MDGLLREMMLEVPAPECRRLCSAAVHAVGFERF